MHSAVVRVCYLAVPRVYRLAEMLVGCWDELMAGLSVGLLVALDLKSVDNLEN